MLPAIYSTAVVQCMLSSTLCMPLCMHRRSVSPDEFFAAPPINDYTCISAYPFSSLSDGMNQTIVLHEWPAERSDRLSWEAAEKGYRLCGIILMCCTYKIALYACHSMQYSLTLPVYGSKGSQEDHQDTLRHQSRQSESQP